MAIQSYFFDAKEINGDYDRKYTADDFCNYLDQIVSNGVFPTPADALKVTGTGGVVLNIAAGQGWIDGHKMVNDDVAKVIIDQPDPILDRIDRVVFYLDKIERKMGITVLKGKPAENPTPPLRSANSLVLADVRVRRGAGGVDNIDITDTRGDDKLCGYVTGLLKADLKNVNDRIDLLNDEITTNKDDISNLQSRISNVENKNKNLTWGTSLTFKMDKSKSQCLIMVANGSNNSVYRGWNSGANFQVFLMHGTNNASFSQSGTESDRTITVNANITSAISVLMP